MLSLEDDAAAEKAKSDKDREFKFNDYSEAIGPHGLSYLMRKNIPMWRKVLWLSKYLEVQGHHIIWVF